MSHRSLVERSELSSVVGRARRRFAWRIVGIAAVLGCAAVVLSTGPPAPRSTASDRDAGNAIARPDERYPSNAPHRRASNRSSTTVPALARSGDRPDEPIERLAQLEQTRDERELLWDAVQARIAACMEKRGFHYERLPYDDSVDEEADRMRFKPSDVVEAGQSGYGLVRGIEDSARREEEQARRPRRSLSPAYREALAGPPPRFGAPPGDGWGTLKTPQGGTMYWYRDSCLTRARDEVYGEDYANLELELTISQLRTQVTAELTNNDAYRAGLERWRTCMAEHGLAYSEPGAAMNSLANDLHAGRLSIEGLRKLEIETAVADTTCYQSARLTDVLAAARERAERVVLARSGDTGLGLRSSLDNAVARAETLLGGDSVP